MCNHNIISRNEKNRSKLVILQSFSILCYIFRKWKHFQITKFNMAGGQPLPSGNYLSLRFELPPNFIFQFCGPQNFQFYLFFPALSISRIHKVPRIEIKVGRSRDPLLPRPQFMAKIYKPQAIQAVGFDL